MPTLGAHRDYGSRLTIYCNTINPRYCGNSWSPSMDQMVQYFGVDFDPGERRPEFLRRFVCEKCGQRDVATIWLPPADTPGLATGVGSHDHGPPNPAEVARIRAEYERGKAIAEAHKANADRMRQEALAAEKAKKKLQRDLESGRQIIGPPNPWAGRKKGRWL
jgi:hypothetical protein